MYPQKLLSIFPIFKIIECLLISLNIIFCSDPISFNTPNKYVIMIQISIATLFATMFLASLVLMSKGWSVTRFYVTRQEATQVTIVMGAIYLNYSAFFVTTDVLLLNKTVKFILILLYLAIFNSSLKASLLCLKQLKSASAYI